MYYMIFQNIHDAFYTKALRHTNCIFSKDLSQNCLEFKVTKCAFKYKAPHSQSLSLPILHLICVYASLLLSRSIIF